MAAFIGFLRKAPPLGTAQLRHQPELSREFEAKLCGLGVWTGRFCRNNARVSLSDRREITSAVLIGRNSASPPAGPQSPRLYELILSDDRRILQADESAPFSAPCTVRYRRAQDMDGFVLGGLRTCQRLGHDHGKQSVEDGFGL